MKTPRYALVVRMTAAAAVALAGTSLAVPALAEAGPSQPALATPSPSASDGQAATTPSPSPMPATESTPAAPAISDAGLAEATLRDLGMTLEQFNAAGELAKRAADAVPSLRGLPGYVGISLKDSKIVVEGSGAELRARVDELNSAGPAADFVLVPPAALVPPKAPSAAELIASSTDQLFEAYVREVGPAGLQAVAYADGHFVIRTGGINTAEALILQNPGLPPAPTETPAATKISAEEFVARYRNVKLEQGAPITTERDVFGGEGYAIPGGSGCSAGFGAYGQGGEPLFLTAGHCAGDGVTTDVTVEDPAAAPAAGAPRGRPVVGIAALGSFGFSQFGGPGNTAITGSADNPGNVGTDIAVIRGLAAGIGAQPAATKWDDVANPGPSAVKIIGKMAPFPGQAVCRSGRATGWKCGTVDSVGIWAIPGPKSVWPNMDNDLRAVRAFDSKSVTSDGGDSGGPWISGNFAVGTHTGAETEGYGAGRVQLRAIAATLEDAMNQLPGVQLQVFLNKPELVGTTSASTVLPHAVIHGRVPAAPASAIAAGSTVRLIRSLFGQVQDTADIPLDAAGEWSFSAPASEGSFQFTAETVNGYSRSGTTAFSLKISGLVAPTITTPAAGSTVAALDRVAGTGTPGNVVKLSGDAAGSGTVGADGRWSVSVGSPPVYGRISVSAVQTAPGHADSAPTTAEFSVTPPAPAVTTAVDGLSFRQDSLPEILTGTGVEGAEVSLLLDGQPVAVQKPGSGVGAKAVATALVPLVLVADGRWNAPFPAGLAEGPHTLAVSQSVDGVASPSVVYRFSISAPPAAASAPKAPAAGALPAAAPPAVAPAAVAPAAVSAAPSTAPSTPPGALDRPGSQASLASTGAGGVLPAVGLAAGALLLGGVLIALSRRRKVR